MKEMCCQQDTGGVGIRYGVGHQLRLRHVGGDRIVARCVVGTDDAVIVLARDVVGEPTTGPSTWQRKPGFRTFLHDGGVQLFGDDAAIALLRT